MAKSKKQTELQTLVKKTNFQIILTMRDNGWCDGCNESVENCLMQGKCRGQSELEELKNAKKDI